MAPRKLIGPCAAKGCGKPIETRGYCEEHYYRLWKFGRLEKVNTGKRRNHPLYILWFERKRDGILCPEWLDFDRFCREVGAKPSPSHFLGRKKAGPYGPDNFVWQAHLKRQKGESTKDWHARKWSSRRAQFPSLERTRDLKRKFGITDSDYDAMCLKQNNKCEICRSHETAVSHQTGLPKRLAIDHCHKTGKIRGLLCWRCNAALGKADDSVPLLKKMIAYLEKHQGD